MHQLEFLAYEEMKNGDGSSLWTHESYVDCLFEYGLFNRAELPREALELYDLIHYEGEVMNGGHAQYLGNRERWKEVPGEIADSCLSGLRQIPNQEYRAIYQALCHRLAENRQRAESIASTHGFSNLGSGYSDPVIEQLDKRFFAINRDSGLGHMNAARFSQLRNVRFLPSDEFAKELALQIANNPHRVQRRAEHNLGRFAWLRDFEERTVESLSERAGLKFEHIIMGGQYFRVGDYLTYGYVIETDAQRCLVCFRGSKEKFLPLNEYRGDPVYLYSFPDYRLLASTLH